MYVFSERCWSITINLCTVDSPFNTAVWSTTTPKFALTHIFCGQIVNKIQAQGDALPSRWERSSSATTSSPCAAYNGFPCRNGDVMIRNVNSTFATKRAIPNQLFFTQSIEETVTYLTTLYNSANCIGIIQKDKMICVHDTEKENCYSTGDEKCFEGCPVIPTHTRCNATCKYPP